VNLDVSIENSALDTDLASDQRFESFFDIFLCPTCSKYVQLLKLLVNDRFNQSQELFPFRAFVQGIEDDKRLVEISEHILKSRRKIFDSRLLMSFLTARVDCVQRFRSARRLHRELRDHRAYKILVALFLKVAEIEIKVDDREYLV
jgi:hypothetical protein